MERAKSSASCSLFSCAQLSLRNFHPSFTLLPSVLIKEVHCSFCHIFPYCLDEWLLWDFIPHEDAFGCVLHSSACRIWLKWVEGETFQHQRLCPDLVCLGAVPGHSPDRSTSPGSETHCWQWASWTSQDFQLLLSSRTKGECWDECVSFGMSVEVKKISPGVFSLLS